MDLYSAIPWNGDISNALIIIIIIIIIITNEKIKVMLSRKRCRGTLQDYNKGEISEWESKEQRPNSVSMMVVCFEVPPKRSDLTAGSRNKAGYEQS